MRKSLKYVLAAILFAVLFFSGFYAALILNSNFGKLKVGTITIKDGNNQLRALLYLPESASPKKPSAAIVLAHGISESKELMSNLGLELAKRRFVVLCLDLLGHGGSDGTVSDGNKETDFGVSAAVHYLEAQTYVNSSEIGLVGHSLGGGAVRTEATRNKNIKATILIAGGIGPNIPDQSEKLNSTFPKNLLVIIGKYDVLFNITELEVTELPSTFNTSTPIVPGNLYGDFKFETARKLIIPTTTHLFETVDLQVASETIKWMENALTQNQNIENETNTSLSYPARELALLFSLIGLVGIILLCYPLVTFLTKRKRPDLPMTENQTKARWKDYTIWASLNLFLFFPLVFVGFVISFPPLIFGSSVAWWVLATGLIGIFLLARNKPKVSETTPQLRTLFWQNFNKEVWMAIILFGLIFTICSLLHAIFVIDLRILAPIFQEFTQFRRILAFAAFIPFFLIYFIAEGLYLHKPFNSSIIQKGNLKASKWASVVLAKISPFLIIIGIQYLPQLTLGLWVLPGFAGLIVEFLWLIIPIFVLTTTCSWWFHGKTGTIGTGAVFNTLLLAWVTAVVFPF